MARARRPHLPGGPFHLTARTQGRTPWFVGHEETVARWIREYATSAGYELLAFAIMPNHLHIVVVQGTLPLAAFMQPLLRRIALLFHACHKSEGHAFQRRFHSASCTEPEYLRNAIAYVHLNPVRAGLCRSPEEFPWSTQPDYSGRALVTADTRRARIDTLRLFSPAPGVSLLACARNYDAFLDWRQAVDACVGGRPPRHMPPRPSTAGGDVYWADRFGWSALVHGERQRPKRPLVDLRDLALNTLRTIEPGMPLQLLCSGGRTRPLVAIRRQFIARAKESGHRHRSIARFLHISDVAVSQA